MLKEAIACFNAKEYSNSKRLFESLLERDLSSIEKIEALTYLQDIYKYLHQNFPEKYTITLISELNFSQSDRIISLYKESNIKNNIVIKHKFLEAFFRTGQIEDSLIVAKEICLNIIEKKAYSISSGIFDNIESKFKGRLFYEFGRLIVSLEMSDYKNAINITDKIFDKIIYRWPTIIGKKKTQDEYINHTLTILESFNVDEFNFRKNVLIWKMKISNEKKYRHLTNKEKMEAVVILYDSPEHYYLLINILKDEFIGYELLDYLKRNDIKDIHSYKKRKILKNQKVVGQETLKSSNKEVEIVGKITGPTQNEIQEIYNKYGVLNDHSIDIDSINTTDINEAIVSLAFIEDYNGALRLLRRLPESTNKNSLEIEILRKKEDYLGVSALCTELLQVGSGEDDLWLIENIIWGFEKSGKIIEAENFRSLLMGYNLTPHSLQKALLNEES